MNPTIAGLFALPERDDYRKMRFYLTYKRAFGGGTNLTRSDIDDMVLEDVRWEWEMLAELWKAEDQATRKR